tara:strand:+ start:1954 stop:2214 length:261 start_codon:yes stop_codon:yes gene_type:complete
MVDSDYLVGLLVVTYSVVALVEVGQVKRFSKILFSAWLIIDPCCSTKLPRRRQHRSNVICGVLLIVLAILRKRIKSSYTGWGWRIV